MRSGLALTISLLSNALTVPSLPRNACAVGSRSALLRCCRGSTSVAAWAVRVAPSNSAAMKWRSGMSMISAGGMNMMANLPASCRIWITPALFRRSYYPYLSCRL
ncbi:hypothetical protein D3C80_1428820 [compost metagenome]